MRQARMEAHTLIIIDTVCITAISYLHCYVAQLIVFLFILFTINAMKFFFVAKFNKSTGKLKTDIMNVVGLLQELNNASSSVFTEDELEETVALENKYIILQWIKK